jgi:AraC-like DNA-binding protein
VTKLNAKPEQNFAGALRQSLQAYLPQGNPGIELAAEIAGTSVRTLQRNLFKLGTTYSEQVSQARFESSKDMLENSDFKITDSAYALGYSDPAHFTRAFRRWTSMTPQEYRKNKALTENILWLYDACDMLEQCRLFQEPEYLKGKFIS